MTVNYQGDFCGTRIHHTTASGMWRVLAEMRRVLNPGGWFYATVVAREESNIVRYWIGCIIRV